MANTVPATVVKVGSRSHQPLPPEFSPPLNPGIPMQHAMQFRAPRVWARITRSIIEMHPGLYERWRKAMFLGYPVLAMPTFEVEGVTAEDRQDGWLRLSKGFGSSAVAIGYPVRIRDDGAIIGHVVAGQDRGGDLYGLFVLLRAGETEGDRGFRERCREALQVHGVEPVQVWEAPPSVASAA